MALTTKSDRAQRAGQDHQSAFYDRRTTDGVRQFTEAEH